MPSRARIHVALITVAILFSLNYIISKVGMHAFHPLVFGYLRVAGSALILNIIIPRDPEPLDPRDRLAIALFALIGVVLNQTLFLVGLSMTNAHIAAVLMTTIPVFTLAMAMMAGRERATIAKVGGIVLAATGALLVVGGEGISGTRKEVIGALMIIGNSLAYAAYLVISKPAMNRLSPRRVITRMFTDGAILMLPVSIWPLAHEQWSAIPGRAWIALLLVIAGPTVCAYLLAAWALAHTDSSLVATYTYVQPFLTAILAALILGERIRGAVVIAAALIFAGIYLCGRPAPPAARIEAVPGNPD